MDDIYPTFAKFNRTLTYSCEAGKNSKRISHLTYYFNRHFTYRIVKSASLIYEPMEFDTLSKSRFYMYQQSTDICA